MLQISGPDVAKHGVAQPLLPTPQTSWRTYATSEELHDELCRAVVGSAVDAIAARGRFVFVITGGRSVIPFYQRLRHIDAQWGAWTVLWSDERCVVPDHADRNSKAAFDAWLSHVPIPGSQIHPIPGELGPQLGAARYDRLLAEEGTFDLVLLSLGDDGHVASLFGAQAAEADSVAALPVLDAPRSPSSRVSLSYGRLADCRQLILVVIGDTKQAALDRLAAQAEQPATVLSTLKDLDVWVDGSALRITHHSNLSQSSNHETA